ncbi:Lar family restriction alleviation protein [Brucella sp. MAB-22]|uniref:Lar family restriction alleviation protein n=1 Tax=Brucella sp. MAB-22 TaxID=2986424 RepID=UPI00221F2470|nr:Lar family restriction alleviation protein [Brucella sp. MAB-22]UYT54106.1 Lar family restriction alleviation protein [Brucella sp. MAB-22]
MASELKHCPFCGSNQLSFRSTPDMDTDGKYHRISCNECGASSRATFAMDACPLFYEELSKAWNTRPAPAATDTGLVTVGHQYKFGDVWLVSDAPKVMRKAGYELREVVTCENAEAVIAKVEAEKAKAIREAGKPAPCWEGSRHEHVLD